MNPDELLEMAQFLVNKGKESGITLRMLGSLGNLDKVKEMVHNYSVIEPSNRNDVSEKVSKIMVQIENSPKSIRWKLRARVGTRVK